MNVKTRFQLSSMMFLEYFVWGAWYVTLNTYLGKSLNFEGSQIGLIYSTNAIAAMLSPVLVGMVADRFFASEKVLAVLHILGAIFIYCTSLVDSFGMVYLFILLYNLTFMPTIALTNALSFHQMQDPGKEFPSIRVLGTIGWIVVGLIIGFMAVEATVVPLRIAAFAALALGLYSFTLPHTPPQSKGKVSIKEVLGLDALKLMKNSSFAVLVICSMLLCIPLAFYYNFTNLFLNDSGIEKAAALMTMGQGSEIIFMLIMPFFFRRLGVKKLIMIAILAWVLRYILFSYGEAGITGWMLLVGIALHGICYDFFFVTGQIYVDKKANKSIRSSAQGLITFATYGVGMFIGANVSGLIVNRYSMQLEDVITFDWNKIWLAPAVLSLIIFIIFSLLFKDKVTEKKTKDKSELATT